MNQVYCYRYHSPCGELILGSLGQQLCLCDWRYRSKRSMIDRRLQKYLKASFIDRSSDVIDSAIAQLDDYFAGHRQQFDIPLLFAGSDFQHRVWQALLAIPYGETRSYNELADSLGEGGASRAVASANGANALSIFVPCHRVIGRDGQLTGYAGGLPAKEQLLDLECSTIKHTQCSLF